MKTLLKQLEIQKNINNSLKKQLILQELELLFGETPEPLLDVNKVLLKTIGVMRTTNNIQRNNRLPKEYKNILKEIKELSKETIQMSKEL